MVLDGVVDTERQPGCRRPPSQADGFERTLGAVPEALRRHDRPVDLGGPPGSVLDRVIASAEKPPDPSPERRPTGVARRGRSWPSARRCTPRPVVAAGFGDRTTRPRATAAASSTLADDYLHRQPDGTYPNVFEIYFAVNCLDSAWPRDPDAMLRRREGDRPQGDPRLGEGLVNDYVRCALWPAQAAAAAEAHRAGLAADPRHQHHRRPGDALRVGRGRGPKRLSRGVLLTNVGEGHTVFGQGKECVDGAVVTYLTTAAPAAPTVCAADEDVSRDASSPGHQRLEGQLGLLEQQAVEPVAALEQREQRPVGARQHVDAAHGPQRSRRSPRRCGGRPW